VAKEIVIEAGYKRAIVIMVILFILFSARLQAQLPTFSIFFFPLSPYENHEHNKTVKISYDLMTPPSLYNYKMATTW
jgi:hypothetical protein